MTHGDQAKAKKANSSQASANEKSSSKTAGQAVEARKSGKGGSKEAGEGSKGGKIISKQQAGAEKGSRSTPPAPQTVTAAKEASGGKGSKARPAPAVDDSNPGFSNAAVAAAFNRALKKYPNAFRKLTDG